MTEYITIYAAIITSNDNREEIRKDLPAEIFFADDDEMAQDIALKKRQILDAIFNSIPVPGFKKDVIIKSVCDQTNKRIIYWIGYLSDLG
ncbi:MAG: hypothetical protein AAB674_01595 [Patescibacteria group bacterium]